MPSRSHKDLAVRLAVLLALLATAACAIDPRPFKGPTGRQAYYMSCSGMGRTLEACYQTAGTICPAGYQIIDARSGTVGVPVPSGGMIAAPEYSLAVECR